MSDCEVCGRPLGDTWASECGPATQDDHWRLGYGRATLARVEAERERDALRVQITSVVHTVRGTVEGHPTHEGNYLQRLRELVAVEVAQGAIKRSRMRWRSVAYDQNAARQRMREALEAGEKAYARLCCGECGCRWGEAGDCDMERGVVCCTCSACREPREALNTARAALGAEPWDAAATPEVNQCDGCRVGLAFSTDGRRHLYDDGTIYMACTSERYEGHPPLTPKGEP